MKRSYRTWLTEDIQQIQLAINTVPFPELASSFGVSVAALTTVCFVHGIHRTDTNKKKHWTTLEIKKLVKNYDLSDKELAVMLNRTPQSVRGYKKRLYQLNKKAA